MKLSLVLSGAVIVLEQACASPLQASSVGIAKPIKYQSDSNLAISTGSSSAHFDSTVVSDLRRRRDLRASPQTANEIDDEDFRALVGKGCALLGAMKASDSEVKNFVPQLVDSAESPWRNPEDIGAWGWRSADNLWEEDFRGGAPTLKEPLEQLGMNPKRKHEGGPNWLHSWSHTAQSVHDGVTYPKTEGYFNTILNADDGIIVAWMRYSATYKGKQQNPPVTTIPKLSRWSDITFMDWEKQANERHKPVSSLRYFMSSNIMNTVTTPLAERILGLEDDELDENCDRFSWDLRKIYDTSTDEGKALLGSPNGNGFAWFLIQHKSVFGERAFIDKVELWCHSLQDPDDEELFDAELNLLFHVTRQ